MLSKGAGVALLCAVSVTVRGSIRAVTAHEVVRASSAATAKSHAATGTGSLPVFYDRALAAQGFPNPLVKARIGGHEGIFIVDTGGANVLAKWYADAAGIPSVSSQLCVRIPAWLSQVSERSNSSSDGAFLQGRMNVRLSAGNRLLPLTAVADRGNWPR